MQFQGKTNDLHFKVAILQAYTLSMSNRWSKSRFAMKNSPINFEEFRLNFIKTFGLFVQMFDSKWSIGGSVPLFVLD